jgi:hypothetical protein
MKSKSSFSRYALFWKTILCYFFPLMVLCLYGAFIDRSSGDWSLFGIGLFVTACGTLTLFWMMTRWEMEYLQRFLPVDNLKKDFSKEKQVEEVLENISSIDPEEHDLVKRSLIEAQDMQVRLLAEIDTLTEELRQATNGKIQTMQEVAAMRLEMDKKQNEAIIELEQQQQRIRELQESLVGQNEANEKKQQQLLLLETKVGGLTSEIKTLLQLAEAHDGSIISQEPSFSEFSLPPTSLPLSSPPRRELLYTGEPPQPEHPTRTKEEASKQLKVCLEIAQKIKASQRFGSQIYSFIDSPADNFSLDLRRLCDRLRGESLSMILLYSPKGHQLLFASNLVRVWTGWSPEKFVQNFHEILVDESEWKQGIHHLAMRSEVETKIQLKTKQGSSILVHASIGMIPTGIFRDHAVAVLYMP